MKNNGKIRTPKEFASFILGESGRNAGSIIFADDAQVIWVRAYELREDIRTSMRAAIHNMLDEKRSANIAEALASTVKSGASSSLVDFDKQHIFQNSAGNGEDLLRDFRAAARIALKALLDIEPDEIDIGPYLHL